jgi:hypothetical protein
MKCNSRFFGSLALGLGLIAGCDGDPTGPGNQANRDYEVWLVDQSDSRGKTYGGALYIYARSALAAAAGVTTGAPARIDLGDAVSAFCLAATGANPVRPHMLMFNSTGSHAVLTFVASGHVVIFDAERRTPVGCVRVSAAPNGGRQAHAATPAPDDSYILVANQNGKRLERITTNYATNQYAIDAAAMLDLASCTTPSGAACESASLRPDNAPIVPTITSTSRLAFVTLRGGGLFVIDPKATPMRIQAEYDRATIRGSGLTGAQIGNNVVINGGAGFFSYRFSVGDVAATNAPNRPAPAALIEDAATTRDSHGMTATPNGRFVWITDRGMNLAEVFEVSSGRRTTVSLASSLSPDPAPDLVDVSSAGDLMFVALRGSIPLSGGAIATGSTPGLGILRLSGSGETGTMQAVLTISNLDGTTERADAHAVRVRVKPSASAARVALTRLTRLVGRNELHAQPVPIQLAQLSASGPSRVGAANQPQECDHGTTAGR